MKVGKVTYQPNSGSLGLFLGHLGMFKVPKERPNELGVLCVFYVSCENWSKFPKVNVGKVTYQPNSNSLGLSLGHLYIMPKERPNVPGFLSLF